MAAGFHAGDVHVPQRESGVLADTPTVLCNCGWDAAEANVKQKAKKEKTCLTCLLIRRPKTALCKFPYFPPPRSRISPFSSFRFPFRFRSPPLAPWAHSFLSFLSSIPSSSTHSLLSRKRDRLNPYYCHSLIISKSFNQYSSNSLRSTPPILGKNVRYKNSGRWRVVLVCARSSPDRNCLHQGACLRHSRETDHVRMGWR